METLTNKKPQRYPWKFLIHSFLGLKLSLFLLFVMATGTIAVVSEEIEWLFDPKVRASGSLSDASWGDQYAAAQKAYPTYVITYASAGEGPYLASQFSATSPSGESRIIFVDPGTGKVAGESGWVTFGAIMRAMHYHLFTDVWGDWGFFAVTSLGFVMIVSLITGLLTYKKFWKGFAKLPRSRSGKRVFWGDFHKLAGLWSVLFVLLIGLTSIWYFAEHILYRKGVAIETPQAVISDEALASLGPEAPQRLPLDQLISIAKEQMPGLRVKQIWFPYAPEEPLSIRGQASALLVRDRTNRVELNSYTGEVLQVLPAGKMGFLERWIHTADPLHFGDFGGLVSKMIWVLFGILLCVLSVSGASIYMQRTAQALTGR